MLALTVAGCASEPFASQAPPPNLGMAGRWTLAAPNAPSCAMTFEGEPGAQQGAIQPDGGCPGKFFMSRRWALAQDKLTIADQQERPLATLAAADQSFQGASTAGTPVTLTRAPL